MARTRVPIAALAAALFALLVLVAACGDQAPETAPAPAAASEPPSLPAVEILSESVGPQLAQVIEILKEPDPFQRAERLAALLPTLDPSTTGEISRMVVDSAINLGVTEVNLLIAFWARHDARSAARWALFESPHGRRSGAIDAALMQLASDDPQAAVALVAEFLSTPSPFAEVAEITLVRAWFASGKPGLLEYIQNLGVGFPRQRALSAYSRALAQRDGAQAALAWAESIPADDEEWQKDVVRQTGWATAMLDPVAAAAWCDRICPERPKALSLRAMIAQRWGAIDGPAAMAWVAKAPLDREQRWAVKGAFNGWWVRDRPGLEKWMESQVRDGKVEVWLQPTIEIFAASMSWDEPEKAIEWSGRIDDDTTRHRTLANVARIWRRNDQPAADAWLDQSPLSEEWREAVRNPKATVKAIEERADAEMNAATD
jgi:hypothetical protein